MKLEDALSRVELLRVRPEVASSQAELENAAHLAMVLDTLWNYWHGLLGEFGVRLLHWGNRGNAALGEGRFLFIQLDTGQWYVQQKEHLGWAIIARNKGLETLHEHLEANRPSPRRFGENWKERGAARSPDPSSRSPNRSRGN